MAWECLDKLEINGQTFNLAQLTDFSWLTEQRLSRSLQREDFGKLCDRGSIPSQFSTLGDMILDCQGLMTESWVVGNENYFANRIGLYRTNDFYSTNYSMFGNYMKDFYRNTNIYQSGWSSGSTQSGFYYYMCIAFNTETNRASKVNMLSGQCNRNASRKANVLPPTSRLSPVPTVMNSAPSSAG